MSEKQTDQQIIELAQSMFPDAENTCVAVDLYAQQVYQEIRAKRAEGKSVKEVNEEIEFYGRLQCLRITLLDDAVREQSAFKIINQVTDDMAIEAEQDIKQINRAFPPSEKL